MINIVSSDTLIKCIITKEKGSEIMAELLAGYNIYSFAFLASVFMTGALVVISKNQNITYYLIMFFMIAISNMGYYTVSTAESLEAALMGHRLIYLGGVFVPVFMLFSIMKLCKIEVPKWLVTILLTASIVVLYFAFSVGYSTVYYKDIALGTEQGMTVLIKEYGPMHTFYMFFLFGSILLTIGVILYVFLTNKNVPKQVMRCMLLIEIVSTLCYLARRILDTNLEMIPFSYVIADIIFLFLIKKIVKYEVNESVINSLDEEITHGYIAFDENRRFVACNEIAKKYLPELEIQKIDEPLDKDKTPILYRHFGENLLQPNVDEMKSLIELRDVVLEGRLKILHPGKSNKIDGYLIELIDDTQQQKYLKLLNHYNEDLANEVNKQTEFIDRLQQRIVLGMADMIENRDTNTGGHVKRTSEVIRIFTKELEKSILSIGYSEGFLRNVAKAAPMHDLGKIAVSDVILNKPGKFTSEEFEEMKKHSAKGAEIVAQIMDGVEDEEFVRIAKNVAHYHHEKWNGQGYPEKLSGTDIPTEARIMALADVFDALVSKRCYKEKMDYDRAFGIIENDLGVHFDPQLGKIFLKCRPQLEAFYDGIE